MLSSMLKSLGARVLLALIAGLAIGIAVSRSGSESLAHAIGWIEPLGTLWINAVRMTVIPLVMGAIIAGIASTPDLKTVGSLGGRAVVLFVIVLVSAALFSILIAQPMLGFLNIDPTAAAALRAGSAQASATAVEGAQKIQSLRQWLVELVPVNPVKAAADGAMLPLIVFTVAFGIALTRVTGRGRDVVIDAARAVTEASLTLVRWILVLAPVAVFILSAVLALKLGVAAAGVVLFYTGLVAGTCIAFMLVLIGIAIFVRRDLARDLPRLWGPPMALGFSSRASMVTLPAMIETAEAMKLPLVIRSFFLPLAVAVFRAGSAINLPIGVLFLARLYGVDLSAAQLIVIALTSVLTTFSIPSIPGGSIIVMVPVLLAANLPVEGIGILLGVDTLPDMFRTTTHVTADLTAATVLGSRVKEASA